MCDVGVFRNGERIGTIAHFTDGPKHRFWCAYSYGGAREKFKTRKAAFAWIVEREEQREIDASRPSGVAPAAGRT
jgi:hypothetical protein